MRATLLIACTIIVTSTDCQTVQHTRVPSTPTAITSQTVEAGCATCIFHMKDVVGCELAVKINGQPYLVTGSGIDDHGDAHAPTGLCNAASQAVIEGKIKGNHFVAKRFRLEK